MCTVLLPTGVNPIVVKCIYHIISYHIISYHIISRNIRYNNEIKKCTYVYNRILYYKHHIHPTSFGHYCGHPHESEEEYHINAHKRPILLLKHNFLNTKLHSILFHPLKCHPQGAQLIHSSSKVNKFSYQMYNTTWCVTQLDTLHAAH
jgi:hypothetical protein